MRFLAVLELYKQGVVDLVQFTNFGELRRAAARRRARTSRPSTSMDLDEWDDGPRPTTIDDDARRARRRSRERARGSLSELDADRRPPTGGTARDRSGASLAATEPVEAAPARGARRAARRRRRGAVRRARGRVRGAASAASCSRGSPAATASRPIPTSRPTSSASCSTASTPACRARRSRRWRSSPTSSRSPAARCRRSAA